MVNVEQLTRALARIPMVLLCADVSLVIRQQIPELLHVQVSAVDVYRSRLNVEIFCDSYYQLGGISTLHVITHFVMLLI